MESNPIKLLLTTKIKDILDREPELDSLQISQRLGCKRNSARRVIRKLEEEKK